MITLKDAFTFIALSSMLGISLQACAINGEDKKPPEDNRQITVPKDTQMVLFINKDNRMIVLDSAGKPIESCNLCTESLEQKYGAHCEKAPEETNICSSLTKATVQDIQTITILSSHKNPHCRTIKSNGDFYTVPKGCNPH